MTDMTPEELRKWVQKDRMGTHWEGCEKSHKDCAILKAADAWDLALVARYAIEEKYRALVKRLEAAERVRLAAKRYLANSVPYDGALNLQVELHAALAGEEKSDGWILSDGHRAGHG